MQIVRTPIEMQEISRKLHLENRTIGFVPTMGALHTGHCSLIAAAAKKCDIVVVSIFVNPTQFGEKEDLEKYPRDLEIDVALAKKYGATIVYAPSSDSMYRKNFLTTVIVDSSLTKKLEGEIRPTHFNGVTTVVLKLFNAVFPDTAFFGQKDAQQAIVIKRMVADLDISVKIDIQPTIREESGLAMSTRNRFLSKCELDDAPLIFKSLSAAKLKYESGIREPDTLKKVILSKIATANYLKIEYLEIVDTELMESVKICSESAVIVIAAKCKNSGTRLIDNIMLGSSL